MTKNLKPLSREDALRLQVRYSEEFLSNPSRLTNASLDRMKWIAVPVPDFISIEQAENIGIAAKKMGVKKGVSVTTEPSVYVEGNVVEMTAEGLLEFDSNCMLRSFLLVAEGDAFAILEQGNYFYLVAGPPEFVRDAVGGSISSVLKAFLDYAKSPDRWKQETRQWLLEISDMYS